MIYCRVPKTCRPKRRLVAGGGIDVAASDLRFTLESVQAFLCHLREIAPVYRFCDRPPTDAGGFLLRHDIDLDLVPAARIAAVEKSVDVRSSLFVMTTNEFYNPAAPPERQLLRQLVADGFEIGLHFDPTVYGDCPAAELHAAAAGEAASLARVTGAPVHSVSLHNPAVSGVYTLFDGFLNAYDPIYFSPDKYISDSYMHASFARNDPYQFVTRGRDRLVQILLHPCQFNDRELGFAEILDQQNHRVRTRQAEIFATVLKLPLP